MKTSIRRLPVTIILMVATSLLLTACNHSSPQARIEQAQQDMAKGQSRTALIILRNVVKKDPQNAQARILLGSVLYRLGNPASAAAQLQQAAAKTALPPQAQFDLAEALLQTGHFDEAEKAARAIPAKTETMAARKLALLGIIAVQKKELSHAKSLFSQALAKDPKSGTALIGQGLLALAEGNPRLADAKADAALAIAPQNALAWLVKGDAALAELHVQDAANALQKAVDIGPPSLSPYQSFVARGRLAQAELTLGRRKDALKNVEIMLKQAPKAPFPNFLRGLIAYQNKNYQTAANHLQIALNADPYNVRALTLLGAAEAAQGQNLLAQNHLSSALGINPNDSMARRQLAELLLRTDQTAQAIQTITAGAAPGTASQLILSLFPSNSEAIKTLAALSRELPQSDKVRLALAQAMLESGENQQALTLLDQLKSATGNAALNALRLKAMAYLRAHQTAKALAIAAQLAGQAPPSTGALKLAAAIYAAAKRPAMAEAVLRRAQRLVPRNADIADLLGDLLLRQGRLTNARGAFDKALTARPGDLFALLSLARIDALQNRPAAMLQRLQQAHAAHPAALPPLVMLSRYYLLDKQPQLALGYAQQAVAIKPDNPGLLTLLGSAQLAALRPAAALQSFHAAAQAAPDQPRYALNLAAALLAQKQYTQARAMLTRVVAAHPDNVAAARALAFTELELDQPQKALAVATRLAASGQARLAAQGWMLEGDLRYAQKHYAAAEAAYVKAQQRQPSAALALRQFLARQHGALADPTQPLRRWLKAHPQDTAIRQILATYELETGDYAQAKTNYRRILQQQPDNPIANNNLAWLIGRHDPHKALPYAERAHRAAPDLPQIDDTLGWLLVRSGQAKRALPLLRRAAQAEPGTAAVQYHYAAALAASGLSAQAIGRLEKLLAKPAAPFTERNAAEALLRRLKGGAG